MEALGGAEGLAKALNVSLEDGISTEATGDLSVQRRQELYGANRFASVPAQSFWAILLDALSDKVLIVLMVAATVCSAAMSFLLTLCLHLHAVCSWSKILLGMNLCCCHCKRLTYKMASILRISSNQAKCYHPMHHIACRYLQ